MFSHEPKHGDQNVFCYDQNKNMIWQIEKPALLHAKNHFISILVNNNDLLGITLSGIEYLINKETGSFIDSFLIK